VSRGRCVFLALLVAACSSDPGLSPLPGPLLRGPQVALVTPTSAVIAWRTDDPGQGALAFGPEGAPAEVREGPGPTDDHEFALAGLAPGTTYAYRLLLDGKVISDGHRFRTAAADPAATLRFAVLGDSGRGSGKQLDIAALLAQWNPDFVLHTGDAIYERGAPEELDRAYFLPYHALLDHIPFYGCLGNHDTYYDGGRTYLAAVVFPRNPVTKTEEFYAFDRGPAHFVVLNSNGDLQPGSVQHDWLAADLAAAQARWKFVVLHHAPYSSGKQGNDPALRAALVPLFEAHHVDVVFAAHDHIYHRSFPLRGDVIVHREQEPDYVDPGAPIYFVTGGGGKSVHKSRPRPFTACAEPTFHYLQAVLDPHRLAITAVRADGTVLDHMSLEKK